MLMVFGGVGVWFCRVTCFSIIISMISTTIGNKKAQCGGIGLSDSNRWV